MFSQTTLVSVQYDLSDWDVRSEPAQYSYAADAAGLQQRQAHTGTDLPRVSLSANLAPDSATNENGT